MTTQDGLRSTPIASPRRFSSHSETRSGPGCIVALLKSPPPYRAPRFPLRYEGELPDLGVRYITRSQSWRLRPSMARHSEPICCAKSFLWKLASGVGRYRAPIIDRSSMIQSGVIALCALMLRQAQHEGLFFAPRPEPVEGRGRTPWFKPRESRPSPSGWRSSENRDAGHVRCKNVGRWGPA